MKNTVLAGLAMTSVGLAVVACTGNQQAPAPIDQPGGTSQAPETISARYDTASDLKPDATPPELGSILLIGTQFDVVLKEIKEGDTTTYKWLTPEEEGGSLVEEEQYSLQNSTFSLASKSAESFNPPIPLLKFPFEVGDTYEWKGEQQRGQGRYPATATITSSSEILNLPVGKFEAIRIDVNLLVEAGSPGGISNTFKFWFKPQEGLVMREFGVGSSREPRNAPAPEDEVIEE